MRIILIYSNMQHYYCYYREWNIMGKASFTPKLLCVLIANLCLSMAYAQTADSTTSSSNVVTLDEIAADGGPTEEQGSKQDIYTKNVANDYLTREEITRYRTDSAGDLLKSMVGVYSMNSRTAGASITPNIRGISGKGRIPFTIDGTEQTVDVWLNNYGVGERNYIDPALLRSIAVEKGPSLSRYMKPGVGGSVAARTIEANDIIPEGDSWGLQLKMEGSGNTVNPSGQNLGKYLGKDYRQFNATADGPGDGGMRSVVLDDAFPPHKRTNSDAFKFKNDMNYMIAGAYRNQFVDVLGAYSLREKGNYIAGTRGAKGYINNPVYDTDWQNEYCGERCRTSAAFIPNMAKMFKPGEEVFNTHVRNETFLLKNNWYLPQQQKISLEYMENNIRFGENNPAQTGFVLDFVGLNQNIFPNMVPSQVPSLTSKLKNKTYKIGYEWKPEDKPWIDLSANLWQVKTNSVRHQSGGPSLAVARPDLYYDQWYNCHYRKNEFIEGNWGELCQDTNWMYGIFDVDFNFKNYMEATKEEVLAFSNPILEGSGLKNPTNIISGAEQRTKINRTGFEISNKFKFNDRFSVTLGGDFQREKLNEKNHIFNGDDLFNMVGMITGMTALAGPRSGKRQEWGINLSAQWKPTDRLTIDAGVRYSKFSAEDVALTKARARREPWAAFGGGNGYKKEAIIQYEETITDDEIVQDFKDYYLAWWNASKDFQGYKKAEEKIRKKYGESYESDWSYAPGWDYATNTPIMDNFVVSKVHTERFPYRNGKLDVSGMKYSPDMLMETVTYQGKEYWKYGLTRSPYNGEHGGSVTEETRKRREEFLTTANSKDTIDANREAELAEITDEERWSPPPKLKDEAWSPMLGITYRLGDNHTLFARYAMMTRFPNIYEATARNVGGLIDSPYYYNQPLKPERSHNMELGWAFNFAPYIKGLRQGNIRLTYFQNKIKNVIDTRDDFSVTQYDERKMSGLELQSQFDAGTVFGSFGMTYRLKQETCDKSTTMSADWLRFRIPTCITGSFGKTRLYQSQLPKYSIVAELGTRLLDENLELGARATYHSKIDTSEYNKMVRKGLDSIYVSTGRPYHYRSHLLVDVYGRYQVNKHLAINAGVTNLTNQYYLDPMSNVPAPGPGRTVTVGIQAQF